MAGRIDLGTLVVSSNKNWIRKGISIYINNSLSGPLSGYIYRLSFLSSGEMVYSIPEIVNDYNNYIRVDNNNYINVRNCQVDPNREAFPVLLLRGIPPAGRQADLPIIIAQTDKGYSTRIHGANLMFRLEYAKARQVTDTKTRTDQSGAHKHSEQEDKEGRSYDIGVFKTGFGKGSSGDETTDPTSSEIRGRNTGYDNPDLRSVYLMQIGA